MTGLFWCCRNCFSAKTKTLDSQPFLPLISEGGAAPFYTHAKVLVPKLTRPRLETIIVWAAILSLAVGVLHQAPRGDILFFSQSGVITVLKVSRETISLELPITAGIIGALMAYLLFALNARQGASLWLPSPQTVSPPPGSLSSSPPLSSNPLISFFGIKIFFASPSGHQQK